MMLLTSKWHFWCQRYIRCMQLAYEITNGGNALKYANIVMTKAVVCSASIMDDLAKRIAGIVDIGTAMPTWSCATHNKTPNRWTGVCLPTYTLYILLEANLKSKSESLRAIRSSVDFSGHVLSRCADSLSVDPRKTAAEAAWPKPRDVHHVRSFLGLANYFCKFIYLITLDRLICHAMCALAYRCVPIGSSAHRARPHFPLAWPVSREKFYEEGLPYSLAHNPHDGRPLVDKGGPLCYLLLCHSDGATDLTRQIWRANLLALKTKCGIGTSITNQHLMPWRLHSPSPLSWPHLTPMLLLRWSLMRLVLVLALYSYIFCSRMVAQLRMRAGRGFLLNANTPLLSKNFWQWFIPWTNKRLR